MSPPCDNDIIIYCIHDMRTILRTKTTQVIFAMISINALTSTLKTPTNLIRTTHLHTYTWI